MATRDARTAPPLRSPRNGLLTVASVKDDETGVRWGTGVAWTPEMLVVDYTHFDDPGMAETWHGARDVGCAMTALTVNARPVMETADPFNIAAYSWCSMMQTDQRDRAGRARRLLEAVQSMDIAYEFWTGTIAQASAANENSWLTHTVETGHTAVVWPATPFQTAAYAAPTGEPPSSGALGRMDSYLTHVLANGTGLLHMSPTFFSYLNAEFPGWLRLDGNIWKSPLGHSVVADAGYTGAAKAASGGSLLTEWVIATGPVEIVLGPIDATTPDSTEAFSFATNDIVLYAQRDVLIEWEPHVAHGAFQFTNIANVFA